MSTIGLESLFETYLFIDKTCSIHYEYYTLSLSHAV